jgi:hypothetical protein
MPPIPLSKTIYYSKEIGRCKKRALLTRKRSNNIKRVEPLG